MQKTYENSVSSITCLCLDIIGAYIEWTDIGLIANDRLKNVSGNIHCKKDRVKCRLWTDGGLLFLGLENNGTVKWKMILAVVNATYATYAIV